MARWAHIVLVGTSVLRNLSARYPELKQLVEKPSAPAPRDLEERVPVYATAVAAQPRRMSAELNALHPYLEARSVERVVLMYTATEPCRLAARILFSALKALYPEVKVTGREVVGLGSSELFEEGVVNLVDALAEEIDNAKKQGLRVALNLTGGFKVEAAYALLAGALLGASKAYYIHESSRTVAELPLPPLTIDAEALMLARMLSESLVEAAKQASPEVLEDLRERGLVDDRYQLRPWVRKLLERCPRATNEQ